eukprot:NODE_674_length_5333_cov_0.595338.p2 type:complete len:403 gc:universal NODE_674_length_5333_cov_0.595338:546-1754(+)
MSEANPYLQHRQKDHEKSRYNDDNFDKNLIHKKRSKVQFRFNEPGKYILKAKKQKLNERIEQRQEIAHLKTKEDEKLIRQHWSRVPVPQTEWWDAVLLYPNKKYADVDSKFQFDRKVPQLATVEEPKGTIPITHLILHPLLPNRDGRPIKIPMYLTKPEIKRMRRLRRQETQKDLQDKILLGEIEDEPKLTLKNFTKVLSPEVLQDPTKAEEMVLDQVDSRRQKHEKHNEVNKLTKEQKSEKIKRKWEKDKKNGLHRMVFKLKKMNYSIKNKIDLNAQQMQMNGCLIWYKDETKHDEFSLLVIEGGRIACNRMFNLINRRIDWSHLATSKNDMEIDGESDDDMNIDLVSTEFYELKWKSKVSKSIFVDKLGDFRVKMCNVDTVSNYLEYIGEEMQAYWKLIQ